MVRARRRLLARVRHHVDAAVDRLVRLETRADRKLALWSLISVAWASGWALLKVF